MKKLAWFLVPFLFVAACALSLDASAQTVCPSGVVAGDAARVCWRNASTMVDGSLIPDTGPESLAQTQVRYGTCTASKPPDTFTLTTVPATVGFVLYEKLTLGVWCFSARHQLVNETWGPWSAWARKTTTAPSTVKPKAPNVTVG